MGNNKALLKNVFGVFIMAHADGDGVDTQPSTQEPQKTQEPVKQQDTTINFETLIAKARQEEKEKLYPQIEKLKNEVANLTQKVNDYILKLAEKDEQIKKLKEELQNLNANPDLTKEYNKLKKEVEELRAENERLKQEYETKINSIELEYYKKEKIAELQGKLIPELVTGTTKEEIDASIELARKRYEEIIQSAISTQQNSYVIPPANPKNTPQTVIDNMNYDDIMRLSPKEWAEVRKKLGLK